MFTPLVTKRLTIRPFGPDDVESLVTRRNEPEVAQHQSWEVPYPKESAVKLVAGMPDGPTDGEWWMAVVADNSTGDTVGDLALHLTDKARTAEIGYTFHREYWGKGYAVEAAESLVAYLFEDIGVTRIFGMLHPDNPASAMVLERVGMVFEGHTRASYWVGDENSDDLIYGMTREDWEIWSHRPSEPPAKLTLEPITPDSVTDVYKLRTHKSQERMVATMGYSFANALFPEDYQGAPLVPWLRAIVANDEIVGFVMLAEMTENNPDPYLWRFLIDRLHQRRGIGARALQLIEEECRRMGATDLYTSWVPGKGSPEAFYLRNGFEPTGEVDEDGEIEGRKPL